MGFIDTIMADSPLARILHDHNNCHADYAHSMDFAEALVEKKRMRETYYI